MPCMSDSPRTQQQHQTPVPAGSRMQMEAGGVPEGLLAPTTPLPGMPKTGRRRQENLAHSRSLGESLRSPCPHPSKTPPRLEKTPKTCPECNKSFWKKSRLLTHTRSHTGERPFVCPDCDRGFSQKCNLQRHQRVHTGEKPFTCSDCGHQFSCKSSLVRHQRIHTGARPFACDQCPKAFRHSKTLTVHQRIHTNQAFTCSHCPKAFRAKWNLTDHQRIHTGMKPHKCHQCGKTFTQKGHLKRHLGIHQRLQAVPESGRCAGEAPGAVAKAVNQSVSWVRAPCPAAAVPRSVGAQPQLPMQARVLRFGDHRAWSPTCGEGPTALTARAPASSISTRIVRISTRSILCLIKVTILFNMQGPKVNIRIKIITGPAIVDSKVVSQESVVSKTR
ncbi:uncharacterized protein LJ264_001013 [Porphyrio hochstetteri]